MMAITDSLRRGPEWLERLALLIGVIGPTPAIRRKRRLRFAFSLVVGAVWSVCLMFVLTQLSVSQYINHGRVPWWVGIFIGLVGSVLFSYVRRAVRSARVRYIARRSAMAGVFLLGGVALLQPVEPAAAQTGGDVRDCDVTAQVVLADETVGQPVLLSSTSRSNPLEIDPDNITQVVIDWNIIEGTVLEGNSWRVWVEVHGFRRTIAEKEAGARDAGRYVIPVEELGSRPPGIIPVGGDFDEVCREESGYIRVVGSPLDNTIGQLASIGLIASSMALLALRWPLPSDLWQFLTPDQVQVRIVDPSTGRPVNGPLERGGRYDAEVTVPLPSPLLGSAAPPHPMEVVAGSLGAALGPSTSALGAGSGRASSLRAGKAKTRLRFEVPSENPLQLQIDVHSGGRVIESIQMRELPSGTGDFGFHVQEGAGHVTYSAGELAREAFAGRAPIDGTVMMHGSASGDLIETWVLTGEAGGRTVARHRTSVAELDREAATYRDVLDQATATTKQVARIGSGAPNPQTMAEVAAAGGSLRNQLLGTGTSGVGVGGSVAIAADIDAVRSVTVPLSGIYEGVVLPSTAIAVCSTFDTDVAACMLHGADVLCPTRFWALRHELIWPRNRASKVDQPKSISERLGLPTLAARRTQRADRASPLVVRGVASEFDAANTEDGPADELESAEGWACPTRTELLGLLAGPAIECDLVYLLAHGATGNFEDRSATPPIVREAYSLEFDDGLFGARELRQFATGSLARRPIVIVNACRSGVIERGAADDFIEEWFRIGAGGVVVTETRVPADVAVRVGELIVNGLRQGVSLSAAVHRARWALYRESYSLAGLAYTCYGPSDARLSFTNRGPHQRG